MMLPVLRHFGIDPLHFGVVMTVNLMIGALTPPFGMLLFTMGPLAQLPFNRVVRGVAPFILPIFVVLVVITYVPIFSLALPQLLKGVFGG